MRSAPHRGDPVRESRDELWGRGPVGGGRRAGAEVLVQQVDLEPARQLLRTGADPGVVVLVRAAGLDGEGHPLAS